LRIESALSGGTAARLMRGIVQGSDKQASMKRRRPGIGLDGMWGRLKECLLR